jgi:hypothetical protein
LTGLTGFGTKTGAAGAFAFTGFADSTSLAADAGSGVLVAFFFFPSPASTGGVGGADSATISTFGLGAVAAFVDLADTGFDSAAGVVGAASLATVDPDLDGFVVRTAFETFSGTGAGFETVFESDFETGFESDLETGFETGFESDLAGVGTLTVSAGTGVALALVGTVSFTFFLGTAVVVALVSAGALDGFFSATADFGVAFAGAEVFVPVGEFFVATAGFESAADLGSFVVTGPFVGCLVFAGSFFVPEALPFGAAETAREGTTFVVLFVVFFAFDATVDSLLANHSETIDLTRGRRTLPSVRAHNVEIAPAVFHKPCCMGR